MVSFHFCEVLILNFTYMSYVYRYIISVFQFHADMYHMALQISPAEGQTRIKESSTEFTDTVAELLKSTRFLIYS